jgi:myo-inositol-1(or 4)-monophosphatase
MQKLHSNTHNVAMQHKLPFRRFKVQVLPVWLCSKRKNLIGETMTNTPEIDELTKFALQLATASAKIILPQFRKNITIDNKLDAGWDPVTEADRSAERVIRELIEKHFPAHGIIGEEFGNRSGTSTYSWVLDPIDGTRSFVIGMPTWATLIGLYRDGEPLLGVMNQPFVGEMFYGSPNGAWHNYQGNTQAIRVRPPVALAKAALGTTSPYLYDNNSNFEHLRKSVTAHRFGGDAYFFALLAAGHLDIAMDPTLQIYDIAALIPIIKGAGGVVGSWTDNDPTQGGNVLCASSQVLLDEAVAVMRGGN